MDKSNLNGGNCSNNANLNKHLSKILYKTNYKINEANYKLISDFENDDELPPELTNNINDAGPNPMSGNNSSVIEAEEETGDEENQPDETGMPEDEILSKSDEVPTQDQPELAADTDTGDQDLAPQPEEESIAKDVDDIQNEMLKSSISAMQKMNSEIDRLTSVIDSLTAKSSQLEDRVKEVEEPTNVEKLMSRKQDSHPFKYNLNDMWDGNWFQSRRDQQYGGKDNDNIKQLEDGTYIASYDELPKFTDQEIRDSYM